MQQTIVPNVVYSGNEVIQDGFSSTAGGQGMTFERQTKIDLHGGCDSDMLIGTGDKNMIDFVGKEFDGDEN